jgi:glycosyltransferase involved in cell wall biosynthesis
MSIDRTSIAYVIESLTAGGAERQMVELIRCLDHESFSVRVLTYRHDDHFLPVLERLRIPVMTLERRNRFDPRPVLVLYDWLRTGQIDLIHSYLRTSNVYAVLARMMARRGKVVTSERSSPLHRDGLTPLHQSFAFRSADMTITNSQSARDDLITKVGINPAKVVFVPNGLDMEEFRPVDRNELGELRKRLRWPASTKIAFMSAGFIACKNHLGLLEALAGIPHRELKLRVYLAGDDTATLATINETIAKRGLSEIVHVLGRRRDVVDLYRACDFLILNSIYEGTPNAVLEAMACGKPVIATNVSDVGRYVRSGDTGWLVPAGDNVVLLKAIEEACRSSEDVLNTMGSAGRRLIQEMRMDSTHLARRHEEIYLRLLGDREPKTEDRRTMTTIRKPRPDD